MLDGLSFDSDDILECVFERGSGPNAEKLSGSRDQKQFDPGLWYCVHVRLGFTGLLLCATVIPP